jgi:hypothetical protein
VVMRWPRDLGFKRGFEGSASGVLRLMGSNPIPGASKLIHILLALLEAVPVNILYLFFSGIFCSMVFV